jgi:hypothetical protein
VLHGSVGDLLEAEADALGLGVELEDLDLDLVADLEQLGRVVDPAPAHVGDVEQAVDAAEVDEGAVLGEVLDDALDDLALGERSRASLLELARSFSSSTRRDSTMLPRFLLNLMTLNLKAWPMKLVEVADRPQIDLRARQEGLHAAADGDREAALHARGDRALDQLVALARGADLVPDLAACRPSPSRGRTRPFVVLAGLESTSILSPT